MRLAKASSPRVKLAQMSTLSPGLLNSLPVIAYGFAALTLLLIVVLAVAVLRDARHRELANKGLFLVGPWAWALIIVATGGFTGALAYWLIHYSSLRYQSRASGE